MRSSPICKLQSINATSYGAKLLQKFVGSSITTEDIPPKYGETICAGFIENSYSTYRFVQYRAFLIRPKICCLLPKFGGKQQILGLIRKALYTNYSMELAQIVSPYFGGISLVLIYDLTM